MNHDVLKAVIFDQQDVIKAETIVSRRYTLDPNGNYAVTGLRRAGKSTLLHAVVRDLVASGVAWERIIYVNFEDERLAEFTSKDFNDLLLVQKELSSEEGFFFLDEVQIVDGWEKFARRLADSGKRAYITGSNAAMLSSEIATTLGGRYLMQHVSPYRFDEYLDAVGQAHDERSLYATSEVGAIMGRFDDFFRFGGFPESLRYVSPRDYVESVYQKVLLGDIAARRGGAQHAGAAHPHEEGGRDGSRRGVLHGVARHAQGHGPVGEQGLRRGLHRVCQGGLPDF